MFFKSIYINIFLYKKNLNNNIQTSNTIDTVKRRKEIYVIIK